MSVFRLSQQQAGDIGLSVVLIQTIANTSYVHILETRRRHPDKSAASTASHRPPYIAYTARYKIQFSIVICRLNSVEHSLICLTDESKTNYKLNYFYRPVRWFCILLSRYCLCACMFVNKISHINELCHRL